MGKCILVTLKNGNTMMVQVAPGTKQLPQSDIDALEQVVAAVKAQMAKKKLTQPHKETSSD